MRRQTRGAELRGRIARGVLPALFSGAHRPKVLGGARRLLGVQHELDPPGRRAADRDVEPHVRVARPVAPLRLFGVRRAARLDDRRGLRRRERAAGRPRAPVAAVAHERQRLPRQQPALAPALAKLLAVAAVGLAAPHPHGAALVAAALRALPLLLARLAARRRARLRVRRAPDHDRALVLELRLRVALAVGGGRRRRRRRRRRRERRRRLGG